MQGTFDSPRRQFLSGRAEGTYRNSAALLAGHFPRLEQAGQIVMPERAFALRK
jgi:hypothetical protein